jgi:hypothetical protein
MNPRAPFPPLGPGRPGTTPGPAASPFAGYQAMQRAALARSVTSGERYLDALRVQDAASRASQLRHLTHSTPQDATRAGWADTAAFAARQRYAAAVAARPRYTLRPGLTPEERLWLHTVATMPYEMALMVRLDPVVRSVAVGGAATVAVATAPVAYAATEDLALEGLERSAALLETEGAMLSAQLQAVTFRSFLLKGSINAIGQGLGNYAVKHDGLSALKNINALSAIASGLNIPLGYNSLFTAGFSLSYDKKFKSIVTDDISLYEFGRDAAFNYSFGKLSAGFKLPKSLGSSWVGLDKLYQTQPVNYSVGFATYQAMLRTGPRIGYGLGLGLNTGLEHGNKVVVGATKKWLSSKVTQLPVPNKANGH